MTVSLRFFTRIHLVKWVGPDDILILFGVVAVASQAVTVFVGMDRYFPLENASAYTDATKEFGMVWAAIATKYNIDPAVLDTVK